MVYIYENCSGLMYVTEEEQDYDNLCCDFLNSDRELFASDNIDKIREFLKTKLDVFDSGGYSLEHCNDIYDECYSKLEEQGYKMY